MALSVVKKPLIDGGLFSIVDLGLVGSSYFYGYALVSPFASLISIIIISTQKEKYMNKLKIDLEKIMVSKNKDFEND